MVVVAAPAGAAGGGGVAAAVRPAALLLALVALAGCGDAGESRTGYLLEREGELRLCTAIAESFPPQCAGDSWRVEGYAIEEAGAVQRASGVAWTDRQVTLTGAVEDGVLRVDDAPG